jgi:HlyD family secretion protein
VHKFILYILIFIAALYGCSKKSNNTYTGYVEGEFVQISAEISGRLQNLAIDRGQYVKKDQLLFSLEANNELYAKQQAQAVVDLKQANLDNLLKGQRPDEIEVLIAKREQINNSLTLAEIRLNRNKKLVKAGAITQDQFDESYTIYKTTKEELTAADAQIRTAKSGARVDEIIAAKADLEDAKANLREAAYRLSKKTISTNIEAFVQDTLYKPNEWIASGVPVITLLPADNLKVRFFVPEQDISSIKTGQNVRIFCDSHKGVIIASINYKSTEVEYTPPIIFSNNTRKKLMFLIEAKIPAQYSTILHPGQPVDLVVEKL